MKKYFIMISAFLKAFTLSFCYSFKAALEGRSNPAERGRYLALKKLGIED